MDKKTKVENDYYRTYPPCWAIEERLNDGWKFLAITSGQSNWVVYYMKEE